MALLCWQIMEREIFFKKGQQKSKNDSLCCKKKQVHEILTLLSKSYIKLWFFFYRYGENVWLAYLKLLLLSPPHPSIKLQNLSKTELTETQVWAILPVLRRCKRKVISRNVKFPFVKIQSSNNADDKDSIPESNIWDQTLNWQVIIWEV